MVQKFEEEKGLKEFTKSCLMNEEFAAYEGSKEIILGYWEQAESLDEFKKLVLRDFRLRYNQGYAELSKESNGHARRITGMLKGKIFTTYSDAGAVKIISDNFSVNISNGAGDGETTCAIITKKDRFNTEMMKFTGTVLKGEMRISGYDCGNQPVRKLNGEYQVYIHEGIVVFVEI